MSVAANPPTDAALRDGFRAEVKRSTRGSGRLLVYIGCVAMMAWSGVDRLLEPANAELFLRLRVLGATAMLAIGIVLLRTRLGERHPEALMLLFLVVAEALIAVMIARLDDAFAAYATGMSLALYGSAFLLIWPWRYTVALIGLSGLALMVALATTPDAPSVAATGTVAIYLLSASALSLAGQAYRHHLAWWAFRDHAALLHEQERNRTLLATLERLTREDDLTGLANRRCWDDALQRQVSVSRHGAGPLALILCDLDRFKDVNDAHGHPAGDHVLRTTARLLSRRARAGDLVARLGGDEFAVLCPGTDLPGARALADELSRCAGEIRLPDGSPTPVTLSFGVAELAEVGEDADAEQLVARADRRLYVAKDAHHAARGARRSRVA